MLAAHGTFGDELVPLWRVASYEREQVVPAGRRFYWLNRNRADKGSRGWLTTVFQYTLQGCLIFREDGPGGSERRVPVGHAVLFAHHDGSDYFTRPEDGEYRCHWFSIEGAGLHEHLAALRARYGSILSCERGGQVARQQQAIIDLVEQTDHDPVVLAGELHRFVQALYQACRREQLASLTPVEQAVERIVRMPTHPWSLKELAAEHGCSREHLVRTFTARMGEAPATWLRQVRVERALLLLRETAIPMAEVARQSGFNSTHTMARQVRMVTGEAPTAQRDRADGDVV